MPSPQQSVHAPDLTQRASRRKFIARGGMMLAGGTVLASNTAVARGAHAYGDDTIKIGLIGCGGRGTAATIQALNTDGAARLVAMADVFPSSLQSAYRSIHGKHRDKVSVRDTRFAGLDAWKHVLSGDADVVILATPPGFRPLHFERAVAAGKHVFMEKPVATDAPGIRRVRAANELAKQKGLAVAVGLQRHHETRYRECIARLQDGAIGDFVYARAYWNGSGTAIRSRVAGMSELEHQIRNWQHFNWIGGDQITEQHIHNLDVINWLMDGHPTIAQGHGGVAAFNIDQHGDTFDHHMVEFTYGQGVKCMSQCRQARGCWNNISEHVHGTLGSCEINTATIRDSDGKIVWKSDHKAAKQEGWQQQQTDWLGGLRRGEILNECDHGIASTMTAIMGRMATYTGKRIRWEDAIQSESQLANIDALTSLADPAPVLPMSDGRYAIATPGQTK